MDKLFFTKEEMKELETLQIFGGDRADPMAQTECVNESQGCGLGGDQIRCVNKTGCTATGTFKNCTISYNCSTPVINTSSDCSN